MAAQHLDVDPVRRGLGRPLADEIVRNRLIDMLAQRWTTRVVLMFAPGGYGKSIALAQAIRDNDSDPTGHDIHVGVRDTTDALRKIAATLIDSLGASEAVGLPDDPVLLAQKVCDAVAAASPHDVCVCLDDLHLSDRIDGLARFVSAMAENLPFNGHLLLAGRTRPDLRLARLRANDDLVEINQADLAFDSNELERLANFHDVPVERLAQSQGWPAVTRLSVVAGDETSLEFMIEEVIDALTADERLVIALAVVAGEVTPALLAEFAPRVDPDELLDRVPLLIGLEGGALAAHDLWHEAIDAVSSEADRTRIAGRVIELLAAAGDHRAAVDTALRHGLWADALQQMMGVFVDMDLRVGLEQVDAWWAEMPVEARVGPAAAFVDGFRARLAGDFDASTASIREAAVGFEEAGDLEGATTAVLELGLRSWLTQDAALWTEVFERSARIIDAGGVRMSRSAVVGRVAEAELRGHFAEALAEYEALPERDELALGHCSTLALLTGDCANAIRHLEELFERFGQPLAVAQLSAARWDAGDPSGVLADPQYWSPRMDNIRDAVRGIFVRSMIEANCGVVPDASRVERLAWARSREQTFVALAFAAHDLLTSHEGRAAEQFERRLDEIGFDEPLLRGELRRYLPYAYVLSERCRSWLDTDDQLGPVQLELRELARALLDLRSGGSPSAMTLPGNEAILTWLPLPWSIELAARLAGSGDPRGVDLARYLSEVAGASVHDTLRNLGSHEPGLRGGVVALLAAVPAPPHQTATITVCTSFGLAHGGDELEVSRARVRQMITLLVLRPDWARETLADVMWPSDPAKARSNFRATLRHVRQALEPNRVSGEADYHLIQQGERIRLRRSGELEVDLWSVQASLADADVADAAGDAASAIRSRVAALDRWGPDAFDDVHDLDAVAPEIERLRRDVLDAGCSAAERTMALGDLPGALKIADRVLDLDPHIDRAHGVAIGVQLALGDLDGAERAIERVRASMEELDLSPSAGIEMLIRRFDQRRSRTAATRLTVVDAG